MALLKDYYEKEMKGNRNAGSSSGNSGGQSGSLLRDYANGVRHEATVNSGLLEERTDRIYTPTEWAAIQAARNQQWREEQAANQNVLSRAWNTLTGAVKGYAGNQAGFFGNVAEGLSRLGARLGGNTSDYAGWATDELSAGQIGMENDSAKRVQQLKEARGMQETGNRWQASGSEDIERAKTGLGFWGGLAVDTGANAVQMGLDSLTSALTGGGGALVPLFTRAAGGAMQEAAEDGAGLGQRLLYGGTVGSIEVATEKLFGGLAKIYGRGTAEGMVESVVRRLTGSAAGQKALLVMADMGGEAIEELISNVANPAAKTIYNGKSLGESYRENFSVEDALYDALVGGIMGGIGAGTKVMGAAVTRQPSDYAKAVQRMGYTNEAEAALREQWGTTGPGAKAATDYAELIGRGMTEGLSSQDRAKLETKPTAAGIMENFRSREAAAAGSMSPEKSIVRESLKQIFQQTGTEVSDAELDTMADGYVAETTDIPTYVTSMRTAYSLGKSGNFTLEQAMKQAGAGVDPVQFRHAFDLGRGPNATEAETADIKTAEGREKVVARLASLGVRAERAADAYAEGQDVARYAAAMDKAVNLYAANGADLKAIYRGTEENSIKDLTPAQIELAQELGGEARAEKRATVSARAKQLKAIREQATQLSEAGAAKLTEINAVLAKTQDHIKNVQQEIDGTVEGLEAAKKSEPGITDTEEYKEAEARVEKMRENVAAAQKIANQLKEEKKKAQAESQGKRKKGTVRYETAKLRTSNGVETFEAADPEKLTRQQKKVAAMVEAMADAVSADFVLLNARSNMGGAYLQGGTIYVNLNSAIGQGENARSIAAASLSHELTHYIAEYAPEEYQELKDFIVGEILNKSPEQFDALVRQQLKWEPNLTYDQAVDELVANACQSMLYDSKAITKLARQNMNLAEKIADYIESFTQKIKDAFSEVDFDADTGLFKPVQAVTGELEKIQEIWDRGMEAAAENAAYRNTATEGGAQMQLIGTREDGIEVYETSEEVKKLPWKQKRHRFMDLMMNEYRGRTAKFTAGNQVYYAKFASDDLRKNIYGDMNSDDAGRDAKVNAGADGDVFDLVENSRYRNSLPETGKDSRSHRGVKNWNYFVKTVQIDGTVFDLIANVREKSTGEFVYSLQLNENKNIEAASPDTRPNQGELNGAPTASKDSIAETLEEVNTNDPIALQEVMEGSGVQYSVFEEDPETLKWLDDQEKAGKVVHTYKSFLEIDGKLYPPMASMKKDETGKKKMVKAMEVGRWEKSVGDLSKVKVDQKLGYGHLEIFKDNGKPTKVAYNPYQHSSNLMLNDQFSEAYQRPNLVTYECIIPESELTSGYRAPYAKDAVGRLPWKSGTVAGKVAKQKGIKRDVFLSRWLKPVRKVPEAEVAQHYKELLDGTDIAVPSNVVPPALLRALEDAGVKIEYDERAPKVQLQHFDSTGAELTEDQEKFFADSKIRDDQGRLKVMYRGGSGDFTVFDRKKSSYTNLYGRGFYFTDSKSHAEQYGKARAFYLNIQNPVQEGAHNITGVQLRKFLREVEENEDYGLENYGYNATVDSVMKSLKGKDDFGILQDINATAIGDFVAAVELFNEVNGTNYDGIIVPTETVAFRADQIKNTDNKAPTSDPDVRFQMISEVEETDRLIAVHNKTMSGLRRMIERGGVPFPSIAIKKAGSGHNHYGPVSIVFGRSRIDPEVNRANRIYGGDAWTPTEPRTEYEADSNKAYKIAEQIRKAVGSKMFESLRMGGSLDSEEIERKLGNSEGNIFEALKGTAVLKYAYLKSTGKEPTVPMKEKRLDGFSKYSNEQLLSLFKVIGPERIRRADYSDQEFRQKVADILNEDFIKDFRKKNAAKGISKEDVEAFLKVYERKPVYSAGNVNVGAIQDALRTFEADGRKLQKEPDSSSFTSELRDNKDLESDPGYRKWIENLYKGIIKNSGIRNDKDVFTPSGNRRSFSQLHVPATLDNIAKVMSKQNEKGVTSFAGSNLMGTGTKTYRTVEEARADRERLYDGDYIDEEEFEGPKKVLNDRLHELVEAAVKITSRDYAWEQRDSAREILLEAVRDSKTKAAMDRKLRSEAQWINYDPALTEELWQLAEDTRNMKVPYFEAKLRRVVYPEEALAYIVEDTAEETDADLLQKMRDMGLTVLTYKAGDAADRLRVLNSVEGAQFQQFDEEDNMHPARRARLNEQTRLEEDLVQYFAGMNQNSDYWMSEEDVRGNLDFNFYNADATAGDTYDAGLIIDALIGDVKGKNLYERQRAYLLAERTLSHLSTRAQQRYTGDGNDGSVIDADFAKWYNDRHPNLYYPGYQPGDLFEHKYNKGGKAENIQKERDYLHGLLESGNLMEPELSEARDLLNQLTNPQPGVAFYQQFDDTYDDTKEESTGRDVAYSRIQSENAILNDVLKELQQLTKKQENTIGKLQQRLKLTKTPEVREGDAKRLAGKYLRNWDSKADRAEITQSIKELGDYVLQGEVNADEVTTRAREIATKIVSAAETTVTPENEALEQIRAAVNGQKVYLSSDMLGELDQSGGLQAVKNRLFGKRVYLSTEAGNGRISVDRLYEQLHADFGEYWFPEAGSDKGPANAGEEILLIAEVLDAAGGMTVNPFGPYMGEAVQSLANDIVSDTLGGIMRPVQTDADKWKARKDGLNERIKELKKQGDLQEKEAARLWQTVYDLSISLDKAESKYKTLKAESEYRVAQTRAEGEAKVTEVRARERERADKQIQGLKDYYKDMRERAQVRREESAGVTKYRKQVQKKAAALYEMLMKNDDKKHVPEVLKKPVAEFLESIDFTSKRQLAGGEETNADKEFGARLRALERALSGQQDYIDGNSEVQQNLGGYVDISQENLQYLRDVIQMIDTALRENRDFTINQMGAAELKQLSNFLSNLNAAIRGLNTFMANARFESVREAADQDIESLKKLGKPGKFAGGAVDRFAAWENGTPYYIMKRFGEGGKSLFDGFAKGWEKMAFNAKEIIDFTEKLYSDKEVNTWKNEIRDIELSDGSKIRMTTAQIMELSMLLNREQALKHIEKGGIRIGDITEKGRVIHDTTHYHLTMEDIVKITGMLDARQRKVAQALQSYMARKGSEWGNEVSMRRFGYEFYTEGEHYYPIKTDANDRPMADTDAQMNSMFRLLNLSASKSLNPKASNALVVGNIFDTFADHMADMAKLNGMGLPILDAIKWFNFKERVNYDDGTYDTRTMQGAMEQAYGTQALKYFRTLMKDINGMTESGDRGVSLPGKLMSNYKIASVGANLRVALLQPTSYVRALTVLKPQYLAGVVPSRAAYQEAMKYSGTAVWKSLGYYDTDISKSMRGQIQHDDTLRDKIANASMVLAEKGDQLTWSRLWTACKRQAKGENANLRGQALMDRTAELFREVVYSSQVMDSTLTRSEIMRGKTNWTKAMSAFMAEPTLSYNILLDAASEYMNDTRRNGKAGAWQRNSGKIGKAFTVYVCSAAFSAVVESIADAARDDDDEKYLDKWLEAFLGEDSLLQGNLAQDLTILGKLPYIKNFISTLQGYGSSDMSTAAFSNLVNAYKIWEETIKLNNGTLDKATKITYYGRMTEWGKIYKTLQALSQLSGVAAANMTRDVTAIWNLTVGSFNPDMKVRTYDSNAMSAEKTAAYEETVKPTGIKKGQYKNILTQADEDGNGSVKQAEMDAYLKDAVQSGALSQEQADAIWDAQGWKKSWTEYGEKSTGTTKTAAKKTSTASAETKKAEKTSSEPTGEIAGWDDFKTVAPIYGNPKKEAAYNAKPGSMSLKRYTEMLQAADTDSNGSLRQDELGYQLKAAVQSGEISFDEAARVWASQGWSHDLSWWAAKHP